MPVPAAHTSIGTTQPHAPACVAFSSAISSTLCQPFWVSPGCRWEQVTLIPGVLMFTAWPCHTQISVPGAAAASLRQDRQGGVEWDSPP